MSDALSVIDLSLLSDAQRGWDWPGFVGLADQLAAVPGGWVRVADAVDRFQAAPEDPNSRDMTWLNAPVVLLLIGQQSDTPTKLGIASRLMAMMDLVDEWDDFFHETLIFAVTGLGPAIVPAVIEAVRETDYDDRRWLSVGSLLDLVAEDGAAPEHREQVIEVCEAMLHDVVEGRVEPSKIELAVWPLAYLQHTASSDLLEQAAQKAEEEAKKYRYVGISELRHAHNMLTGKTKLRSPNDLNRFAKGPEPVFKPFWKRTVEYWREQDRGRQADFEANVAFLTGTPFPDPFAQELAEEMPPPSSRKIGRNEPCPCGSGKKYKKCCGPKRR